MRLKIAWVCLAAVGLGIVAFGVMATVLPTAGEPMMRTAGVASLGMGLFGLAITLIPFRGRRQWAWYTLWLYPLFWIAHFAGRSPPGKDHVHQVLSADWR
jgi:hypothetical protein